MYLLVLSLILAVTGGANIVFAFTPPPQAIESIFDGASRRIRFLVQFLPEHRQTMAARLLTGLSFLLMSAAAAAGWYVNQG